MCKDNYSVSNYYDPSADNKPIWDMDDRLDAWDDAYWNDILLARSMRKKEISKKDVLDHMDKKTKGE